MLNNNNNFINLKLINETFFLKSYYSLFNLFFNENLNIESTFNDENFKNVFSINDIFLNFTEKTLYTKDNLSVLSYFLLNNNTSSYNFYFFTNFINNNFFLQQKFLFSSDYNQKIQFFDYLMFSNINIDKIFLKDLSYFSMFK